jgi:cold shock CspA family protein
LEHTAALDERIRARARDLEQLCPAITGCSVVLTASHRHRRGNLYSVHIRATVPGKELVVSRDPADEHAHEDAYVAIRDAFNAADRIAEDYVRKHRHQVKHHEVPMHGRVTKIYWHEGFGFLENSDGEEIYFHRNSVPHDGFLELEIGDEVRFSAMQSESEKGPQAASVVRIGKHHLVP